MEELKLILSTIENVSDGAMSFAIWWLVKEAIVPIVVPLCILLPVGWIAKSLLIPVIRNSLLESAIMSVTGITIFLSASEKIEILNCLKTHYRK